MVKSKELRLNRKSLSKGISIPSKTHIQHIGSVRAFEIRLSKTWIQN